MGAAIAQALAVRHSGRVRSLTALFGLPADTSRLGLLRHLRVGGVLQLARLDLPDDAVEQIVDVTRALAGPVFPFDEDGTRERARRDAAVGPRDDRARNRQLGARWTGPGIDTIRCPTLVVHGGADPIVRPSAGRALARRIPGARLVVHPGLGHYLPPALWGPVADAMAELAAPVS